MAEEHELHELVAVYPYVDPDNPNRHYAVCRCGWRQVGDTPEGAEAKFEAHAKDD
jgi:hypothetical protein